MKGRMKLVLVYWYSTDFACWYGTSNMCGSSVAGVSVQDRSTSANLEQVSQNMCGDMATYPGIYENDLHIQIPIPKIWRLLKKPIGLTFWRRIALHLWGFIKITVDSHVPYNVRS